MLPTGRGMKEPAEGQLHSLGSAADALALGVFEAKQCGPRKEAEVRLVWSDVSYCVKAGVHHPFKQCQLRPLCPGAAPTQAGFAVSESELLQPSLRGLG